MSITVVRTADDAELRAQGIELEKLTAGIVQNALVKNIDLMQEDDDWSTIMTATLNKYVDKIVGAEYLDVAHPYEFNVIITFKDNSAILIKIEQRLKDVNIKTSLAWEIAPGKAH